MRENTLFVRFLLVLILFMQACKKDGPGVLPPEQGPAPPGQDQAIFPKKEMRAVWMTTVWGLDWPRGKYSVSEQKQQYIAYLDRFVSLNINAVFFQVKGMGDAMYPSSYEPWSSAVTGVRGRDPGYDVLKFMIDEAHARGIEFHAWMNPYRIAMRSGSGTPYPALHPSIPPEWVVNHEKIQIYNPAKPAVRDRLAEIVREMITRYDVDGIHFDDYFYPDPASAGQMVSDQSDYEDYGSGYQRIEDFRRGNVDKAIESVHRMIVVTKPSVVFSVSPAPSRNYNYNTLFADVVKWDQQGWIDVVVPQLYQEIGNPYNDFQSNLLWWSQNNNKTALMIGYGFYKFGDPAMPAAFQSSAELQRQFDLTRSNPRVVGHALFSARFLEDNKVQATTKLADLFKTPSVMPFLGRATVPAPATPSNVQFQSNTLKWDGSANNRYVVYHFADFKQIGKVIAITASHNITVNSRGYYCVTALNADNQESHPTVFIEKK